MGMIFTSAVKLLWDKIIGKPTDDEILNSRITFPKSDWNAASGDANEILNKPAVITNAERQKLALLQYSKFHGTFNSVSALTNPNPANIEGVYAFVDTGIGADVLIYIWDVNDAKWVKSQSSITAETQQTIKQKYELNLNTNAFTDALKNKLNNSFERIIWKAKIVTRPNWANPSRFLLDTDYFRYVGNNGNGLNTRTLPNYRGIYIESLGSTPQNIKYRFAEVIYIDNSTATSEYYNIPLETGSIADGRVAINNRYFDFEAKIPKPANNHIFLILTIKEIVF